MFTIRGLEMLDILILSLPGPTTVPMLCIQNIAIRGILSKGKQAQPPSDHPLQEFVSSYDTAHHYADADAHKWVSHRNHCGNIRGVGFVWLLNPNRCWKLLKISWTEAVFGMFKYQLRRASLTEHEAFAFLKADGDGITLPTPVSVKHCNSSNCHCYGLQKSSGCKQTLMEMVF